MHNFGENYPEPTEQWKSTYMTSVKKILPLGWTLMSLRELNWRPKKLSKMTVALYGAAGLTMTIEGGLVARPDVIKRRVPLYGPVPPFVI
jgi:hypothetical protein